MTKENAIKLLESIREIIMRDDSWLENTHEPINEAFDMAQKALKQGEWIPVSERMTNIGYQDIIDRIVNRTIEYPKSYTMTVRDMQNWLNGYAKCQFDILDIIKKIMDGDSE